MWDCLWYFYSNSFVIQISLDSRQGIKKTFNKTKAIPEKRTCQDYWTEAKVTGAANPVSFSTLKNTKQA